MGHDEFIAWLAYYSIEPFGGLRADIHAALGATMLANVNRDAKKRKTPFKPADFMPDWWKDKAQEGPAQVAGMLAKMQMFGGGEVDEPLEDRR